VAPGPGIRGRRLGRSDKTRASAIGHDGREETRNAWPGAHRNDLERLFPEPVLTVEEVATRLRRHEVSVIRAIKRGELAA
jgi:hypothetical protein